MIQYSGAMNTKRHSHSDGDSDSAFLVLVRKSISNTYAATTALSPPILVLGRARLASPKLRFRTGDQRIKRRKIRLVYIRLKHEFITP